MCSKASTVIFLSMFTSPVAPTSGSVASTHSWNYSARSTIKKLTGADKAEFLKPDQPSEFPCPDLASTTLEPPANPNVFQPPLIESKAKTPHVTASGNSSSKSKRAPKPRCPARTSKLCKTAARCSSTHCYRQPARGRDSGFLRVDPAPVSGFLLQCHGCRLARSRREENNEGKKLVDGQEKEIVETTEEKIPGYLEAVITFTR